MSETGGREGNASKIAKVVVKWGTIGTLAGAGAHMVDTATNNVGSDWAKDKVGQVAPGLVEDVERMERDVYNKTKGVDPVTEIAKKVAEVDLVAKTDLPQVGAKFTVDVGDFFKDMGDRIAKGKEIARREKGLPIEEPKPTAEIKMTEQIKIKAIPLVEGYGFFQPTQEKIAAGNLLRDLRQWYGSEVSNIHAQLYVLTFPGNNESGDKKTMYMAIVDPAGQNSDGDVRNVAILEQDNPAIGDRFALQAAKKKVEDDKEVYIFSLANSKNHTDSLIGYELEVSSLDNKKVDKLVIRDSEGRVLVSVDSTTMAENSEKTQEGQVPLYNSFFINRGGTYRKAVNMADTSVMTEDAHDRARKRTLDK